MRDEDSDLQEEDNLMTDQQKEEEAMFKHTFAFYQTQKGGQPIERYELPMILDGKSTTQEGSKTKLMCFDVIVACGYRLPDETLVRMQEFLDTKNL